MDDNSDDIFAPSEGYSEGPPDVADSEDDVAGSASSDGGVGGSVSEDDAPGHRRRARRPLALTGIILVLLTVSPTPLFPNWSPLGYQAPGVGERPVGTYLHGAALARWFFTPGSFDDESKYMESLAVRQTRAEQLLGLVWYSAEGTIRIHDPVLLPHDHEDPARVIGFARDAAASLGEQEGPFGRLVDVFWDIADAVVATAPISAALCRAVLHDSWRLFHAVALTARLDRSRMLGRPIPPATLKHFRGLGRAREPPRLSLCSHIRRAGHWSTPVEDVLDWLWATRTMGDLQLAQEAKRDWARIFVRGDAERAELVAQSSHVHKDTLRQARVKADCVHNLLMRAVFHRINSQNLELYLFSDGSPQFRGHELFATSMDIIAGAFFKRLLLPLVSLARCALGLEGNLHWGC